MLTLKNSSKIYDYILQSIYFIKRSNSILTMKHIKICSINDEINFFID